MSKLLDFLNKYEIQYVAIGGTVLGAFRHKGFIPWDEDVDLGMNRENYSKFLKLAAHLDEEYFYIVNYHNTKKIEHGLTKIGLKGSYLKSRGLLKGYDTSFHIDIFPLDCVPSSQKEQKKHAKKTKILKSILYFKSKKNSSKWYKTIALKILQSLLLPFSSSKIAEKLDLIAQKYERSYFEVEAFTNVMGAYSYNKEMIKSKVLGKLTDLPFGPLKIKVPEDVHAFLTGVYGSNYMIPFNRSENLEIEAYILNDQIN
ncbi:MAG: LicD family protein [Bacteroidales bacterium]|nr:LicD family protein [Bacteroidales bacterium]